MLRASCAHPPKPTQDHPTRTACRERPLSTVTPAPYGSLVFDQLRQLRALIGKEVDRTGQLYRFTRARHLELTDAAGEPVTAIPVRYLVQVLEPIRRFAEFSSYRGTLPPIDGLWTLQVGANPAARARVTKENEIALNQIKAYRDFQQRAHTAVTRELANRYQRNPDLVDYVLAMIPADPYQPRHSSKKPRL